MQKRTDAAADSCSNFFFFSSKNFSFPAFLEKFSSVRNGNEYESVAGRERGLFSLYTFLIQVSSYSLSFSLEWWKCPWVLLAYKENKKKKSHYFVGWFTHFTRWITWFCSSFKSIPFSFFFLFFSFKIDDNSTVRRNVWIQSVIQTDNWDTLGVGKRSKNFLLLTLL